MADLATVVAAFERLFETASDGPAQSTNQHGEIYAMLCSGGIKGDLAPFPAFYASAADAVDAWWRAAHDLAVSAPGRHLYWRKRPTLEVETVGVDQYHFVICRLVVSMKAPPTPQAWMRRWKCHKVVDAETIVRVERAAGWVGYLVAYGEVIRQPVEDSFFARGAPENGDYLVRYEDGYLSWSPKKAFEDGYTLVSVMSETTAAFNPGPSNQYPELFKQKLAPTQLPDKFDPGTHIEVVCGGLGFRLSQKECQDGLWRAMFERRLEALMDYRWHHTDRITDPVYIIDPRTSRT